MNEFAIITYVLYASSISAALLATRSRSKPSLDVKYPSPAERRPRVQFKNKHGVSGIFSIIFTVGAISANRMLSYCSVFTSFVTVLAAITSISAASSGLAIVDKAPKQSVVMETPVRVVPPHRDAFKRTAYSIFYLCTRLFWETVKALTQTFYGKSIASCSLGYVSDWLVGCIGIAYAIKYFIPRSNGVDWTNGNTYIFVVPMAVGLSCDALFQMPILQCRNDLCWNVDVVDQFILLCVLLSGLIVAFIFTLSFHGALGIRKCYWGSALVVHGIVIFIVLKALPYLGLRG